MRQNVEWPKKYVIRNAFLKFDDYFVLIVVLLYLIMVVIENGGNNSGHIIGSIIVLFFYLIASPLKRLLDRSDKIVIDKNGIKICDANKLIDWQSVNYVDIERTEQGEGRTKQVDSYLRIHTTEGVIRVKMSDFSYSEKLLFKAVNHFSGRNISNEPPDLFSVKVTLDDVKKIIGSERNVDKISKTFSDYRKKGICWGLILLGSLIGISIYLQIIIDFPYVFAIGFVLTWVIMHLVEIIEERRLRSQKYIYELDDTAFTALKKAYELEVSRGANIAFSAVLIVVAIVIFIVSYLIDNQYILR